MSLSLPPTSQPNPDSPVLARAAQVYAEFRDSLYSPTGYAPKNRWTRYLKQWLGWSSGLREFAWPQRRALRSVDQLWGDMLFFVCQKSLDDLQLYRQKGGEHPFSGHDAFVSVNEWDSAYWSGRGNGVPSSCSRLLPVKHLFFDLDVGYRCDWGCKLPKKDIPPKLEFVWPNAWACPQCHHQLPYSFDDLERTRLDAWNVIDATLATVPDIERTEVLFSGLKGHAVHVWLKNPAAPDAQAIHLIQSTIVSKAKATTADPAVIGDLKRVHRLPYTPHPRSFAWCIPVKRDWSARETWRIAQFAVRPPEVSA